MAPSKKVTKTETAEPVVEDKKAKKTDSKKPVAKADSKKPATKADSKKPATKADSKKPAAPAKAAKAPKEPKQPKEKVPKEKRDVTKDTVAADFKALEESVAVIAKKCSGENKRELNEWIRAFKVLRKDSFKTLRIKNKREGNNENCGFKKPVEISTDLAKFCGFKAGEKVGRDVVTQFMCKYVKDKDLQHKSEKKYIIFDDALKSLFKLKSNETDNNGDRLTYCSIQKLLTQHFPKSKGATKAN